jgi:hypothetical protein
MTRALAIIALAAALATTGCLQKATTSTIYLQPDGSFEWVVLERDVRSDEADAAKRDAEEFAYVDAIGRDSHGVAESFRALGGRGVRTRLLRDTRPYAAMVDARFDSLSRMIDGQLAGCGITYESTLTVDGDIPTWRFWADVGVDGEKIDDTGQCGSGLDGLSDALEPTIILQRGSFTKAVGFTLKGTDTATLPDEEISSETLRSNNGLLTLSLSWKTAR